MSNNFDFLEFRKALGAFATGVTIVTTRAQDGRDVGLTASSFNSVSLDPPMVLWSLAKSSGTLTAFSEASHFAVHILATDQEAISNLFASRGIDKFSGLTPERGVAGIPLLSGCAAVFQCRTTYCYEGGDHVIFVGEVVDFEQMGKSPLVFHGGRYARAESKDIDLVSSGGDDLGAGNLANFITRVYLQLVTPMRLRAEKLGLSAADRYMMNLLLAGAASDLASINEVIGHTGVQVSCEAADALVQRGLLERHTVSPDAVHFYLTSEGRRITIELLAAAKAIEADAQVGLTYGEQRLLRELLTRISRSVTEPSDDRASRHMDFYAAAVERASWGQGQL